MLKKYSLIAVLLFLGGCNSIPEIAVPDLPSILQQGDPVEGQLDTAMSETNPMGQLDGYESRGNGYFTFHYNDGHLETIRVKLLNEEIVLSKGQTIIKKLPVGTYSFDVSGKQKYTKSYSHRLAYDGDTAEYRFSIPSPSSAIGSNYVSTENLNHRYGILIVASNLLNPLIELTKLDTPSSVFLVCNDTDECTYSDNVAHTSPLKRSLPEGNYMLKASGRSKELYVRAESFNTVEITSNGFKITTK